MRRRPGFFAIVVATTLLAMLGLFGGASRRAHAATAGDERGAVSAALHRGTLAGDTLTWRSTFVLATTGDDALRVPLATPLPEEEALVPSAGCGVTAVRENGRITALDVSADCARSGKFAATFVQHIEGRPSSVLLGAPLARGNEVQIVDITGERELRFEPSSDAGIEAHVGFFAAAELTLADRARCNRLVAFEGNHRAELPIYLRANALLVGAGGLRGSFSTAHDRMRGGTVGAAVAFVALVVGLALVHRRFARSACEEAAEATLRAEFDKLDRDAETQ